MILYECRKQDLHHKIQQISTEQEIYYAHGAHQNWMQLGDKNNKYFQTTSTIRKRQNTIRKTKDNYENWFEDQIDMLQVFLDEFSRRFKREPM